MKKLVSVLLTVAVALSLMVVPAVTSAAEPPPTISFVTRGTGTAALTTETSYSGLGSAKLTTTIGDDDAGMVRFEFGPGELTLDNLTALSYWENVSARENPLDVFIDIWLDFDGDGDADVDDYPGYMQAEPIYTVGAAPLNTWTQIDAMNLMWSTYAGPDWPYEAPTISDFQANAYTSAHTVMADWTNGTDFGPLSILRIDIRVGYGGTWDNFTGYTDDIVINDYTQGFDPTGSVSLTAETSNITAISVTPTNIGFGPVTPGTPKAGNNITVENIGGVKVVVDATVDPVTGVFKYLQLGVAPAVPKYSPAYLGFWDNIISGLDPSLNQTLTTVLDVPSTYSGKGVEAATLIFEATAA